MAEANADSDASGVTAAGDGCSRCGGLRPDVLLFIPDSDAGPACAACLVAAADKKAVRARVWCAAHQDGDCGAMFGVADCPQERDGEPAASGRSCPLRWWGDDEE